MYKVKHSLSTIVFNFNIRVEDYYLVSEIFKIVPKFIQGSKVEINFRENYGMSYGAWSDIFLKNKCENSKFNETNGHCPECDRAA